MRDPQAKVAELTQKHGLETAQRLAWARMNDHEKGTASWQFWSAVVGLLTYKKKFSDGKPNNRAQRRKLREQRHERRAELVQVH